MKFSIDFERTFAHPPDRVWRAITDPQELGRWLMETDFAPEAGRGFSMRCDDGCGGEDVYACKVLEIEPEKRMRWSWQLGEAETIVEFTLEPVGGGTRLTVAHSGDIDPAMVEGFKGGWPGKLEAIDAVLAG